MTTQSPDQSLSQSKGEQIHPELEAIVLKWAYIGRTTDATREESILGAINEALALSQSPAPSKETEELPPSRTTGEAIERLLTLAGISVEAGWTFMDGNVPRKLDEVRERIMELYNAPLAAELAKEREGEVATLRAELADRWRDMTANEQQTQRLLNDIENLRAEIAELKARP